MNENLFNTNILFYVNGYYIYLFNKNLDYKYHFHYVNNLYYLYIENKKNIKDNLEFKILKNKKSFNYYIKNQINNIAKLDDFDNIILNDDDFLDINFIKYYNSKNFIDLNLISYKKNLFENNYINEWSEYKNFLNVNWYFYGRFNRFQYFKYIILKYKDNINNISYERINYDKNKDNTLIFIDDRFDELFKYILILFLYSIDNTWNLRIYTTKDNIKYYKQLLEEINVSAKILKIDNLKTKNDYSNLLKNYKFWENINESFCLIFQLDSISFQKFDKSFFKYNYLGARWPENITQLKGIYNGNGGTSFRNVRKMEYISKKYNKNEYKLNNSGYNLPEDVYFCKHLNKEGLSTVDFDILDRFSFECIYNENSIYGHAIYESIDLVYLEEYIIKRLYKIF